MATLDEVERGQAVYTPLTLRWFYDFVVLGVSNRFLWKCPTADLLAHYNANISASHLDIGVGTGWFLDRCRFPSAQPRLALMDLNPHCLAHAAARIGRYRPELLQRNVLEPIIYDGPKFDSVGLGYLLHCLPGRMAEKAVLFDHVRPLANPGARLFGSTILQGDVPRSHLARKLMDTYNAKGVFSNRHDDLASLTAELRTRFTAVEIKVTGCVALFRATL